MRNLERDEFSPQNAARVPSEHTAAPDPEQAICRGTRLCDALQLDDGKMRTVREMIDCQLDTNP